MGKHTVRFLDDFLIMFQYERDAQRVYEAIIEEWNFDWNYPKEKTRILPFEEIVDTRETLIF